MRRLLSKLFRGGFDELVTRCCAEFRAGPDDQAIAAAIAASVGFVVSGEAGQLGIGSFEGVGIDLVAETLRRMEARCKT